MTVIAAAVAPGRARIDHGGGPLAVRVLRVTPDSARIGLVATEALLLGGDRVEVTVRVGAGMTLEIVETAGTVAYDGDGVEAGWTVRIELAERATLIWLAEPFVVSRGANVLRHSTIELADTAVALLRETLVLGRSGEVGGALRIRTRVSHGGEPLLAEDLDLADPPLRGRPGLLGAARVVDSLLLLGSRAPHHPVLPPGARFELAGPGTLARVLRAETADSPVPGWAAGWAAHRHTAVG